MEIKESDSVTSIKFGKMYYSQIIRFLYNNSLSINFILVLNLIYEVANSVMPLIDGYILNSISIDNSINNVIFWAQVKFALVLTLFLLVKVRKKFPSEDHHIEHFRKIFYRNLLDKDVEFFDNIKPQILNSILCDDIYAIKAFMPCNIELFILSIAKFIFCFISLICISWELFLIQMISFFYNFYYTSKSGSNTCDEFYKLYDIRNHRVSESLLNINLVKAFSTEKKHIKIFNTTTDELVKILNIFFNREMESEKSIFAEGVSIFEMICAGKMIINRTIGIGDYYKFQVLSRICRDIVGIISNQVSHFRKEYHKVNRIFQIMEYVPKIFNTHSTCSNKLVETVTDRKILEKTKFYGEIKFVNVDFYFPTRPKSKILNNLNFSTKKGEVLGFVSSSGTGKSTIVSLIHRLYDPSSGSIFIDGQNIKNYDLSYLHSKIGYVPQEAPLFSLTIKENILYGVNSNSKISDEKLFDIIKKANCEFIFDSRIFPNCLDTPISSTNISGGQKQRIAIARALIKDAKILIFDEATSALDSESETQILSAIDNIVRDGEITTIIIAHRLSTIKNCSRIIALKHGEVIEEGDHTTLMNKNGFYKQLIDSQIVKEY